MATVAAVIELTGIARAQMPDLIVADLATAQELTGLIGRLDRIDVKIDSPDQKDRLEKMLPPGLVLRSTQQQKTDFAELIGAYRMNLSALSLMAAFVAIFIVYNSMLISVRQRLPALGILRCLAHRAGNSGGSTWSRRWRLRSSAERSACSADGDCRGGWSDWWQLPSTIYTRRSGRTRWRVSRAEIGKGFAVALGSCLIRAAVPLWQAAHAADQHHCRQPVGQIQRRHRRLAAGGAVVLGASIGVYIWPGNSAVAGFVMALFIATGFALVCPAMTRVICRLVERIARPMQSLPVQMAAAGVGRTLGITGVAVAAMMLAMAMNVGVRTMTSSFRSALSAWIDHRFDADVFIAPDLLVNYHIDAGLDPAVEKWVRAEPQFAAPWRRAPPMR